MTDFDFKMGIFSIPLFGRWVPGLIAGLADPLEHSRGCFNVTNTLERGPKNVQRTKNRQKVKVIGAR